MNGPRRRRSRSRSTTSPSQGNKNLLTIAAEAQAKSGHDILAMPTWWPHANAELLEPVNDIMEPLIKQNGDGQRHGRVSRPARRQMARRSRLRRQPDQGALLAHRPDEEVRRHRRAGDVSGRRAAQGRQLDTGYLPEGGRGLPQGRRSRSASASARPPTTSIPPARSSCRSAPSSSTPRAISRSRPTRCGRRSNTTRS